MTNITEPLAAADLRCYELFRDGSIAFVREGQLCFGPTNRLDAFLSANSESFLLGETAQAKIAQLRAQQGQSSYRSTTAGSDEDSLAQTRNRCEAERSAGQWEPEFIRRQLEGLR